MIVDPGPPVRVAVSWGGILDNWRGLVHDPTGEAMKAKRLDLETWSNRGDPDDASVAGLFGGTLVRARHLEGDWYLCWFTGPDRGATASSRASRNAGIMDGG